MKQTGEIVVRDDQPENLILSPVMDITVAKRRLEEFQEFVRGYLIEGEDYGTIPGTPKPTLLKPGADKLCELYGLADEYQIVTQVERFDLENMLFDYTIKCILTSRRTGGLVATGLGSCNSYEGKFRWREVSRVCPDCGKAAIIRGKQEFGGGWLCYARKGGCGAKFHVGDASIESQPTGRIPNDDIATLKNTILKMAKKRAKVDATLGATRSSGIFTQDVEDTPTLLTQSTTVATLAGQAPTKSMEVFVQRSGTEATVSGATYLLRANLKEMGAKFDANSKAWKLPSTKVNELLSYCKNSQIPLVELDEEGVPIIQETLAEQQYGGS